MRTDRDHRRAGAVQARMLPVAGIVVAGLLAGCGTTLTVEGKTETFDEAAYLDDLQYCRARFESDHGDVGEGLFYLLATVAPTEGINRYDKARTRPSQGMFEEDAPPATPEGRRLQDVSFERDDRVRSATAEAVATCLREKGYAVRMD